MKLVVYDHKKPLIARFGHSIKYSENAMATHMRYFHMLEKAEKHILNENGVNF